MSGRASKKAATAKSSPILILHGLDDGAVPAGEARRLAAILDAVQAPYKLHLYPDAGYEFDRGGGAARQSRLGRNSISLPQSGPHGGDTAADTDAWNQTTAFLYAHL
jgi:dienelactone hydrolase